MKKILVTAVVLLVVFGALFFYKYRSQSQAQAAMAGRKPQAATVTAAPATQANWVTQLSAVGTLESYQGVTVSAEVEGRITRIAFESGARVEAGAVLVELDTSTEQARLHSLEAAARLAGITEARQRGLRENGTISQSELDEAEAMLQQNTAAVEELKTTLEKKRIVAPFAGRVGIRAVNVGEFIAKGAAIVTLENTDPIYVDFGLPQQEVARVAAGLAVHLTLDAFPGRIFEGKVEAVSPRVSSNTRNLQIRATVPNPDETLRPGMFGDVTVDFEDASDVVVLPATAIVFSPYGNSIYVINEKDGGLVVEQRFVTTGQRRGDQIAITRGVEAGEQVVTAGQIKLRNGASVVVNNTVTPANDPDPHPAES